MHVCEHTPSDIRADRYKVKRLENSITSFFYRKFNSQKHIYTKNDKPTFLFTVLVDIFRAARAPEDAHNIGLLEPAALIMKFPNRDFAS